VKKPYLVGTYTLGYDNVRVVADGDTYGDAAAVWYNPSDGGCEKIVLKCKGRTWGDCVAGLLHEAMEAMIHRRGLGYSQSHAPREVTDGYLFIMSHHEFDQLSDWVGPFLAACLPDFSEAWKKANKKNKHKGGGV
jgi:hypothetical protein